MTKEIKVKSSKSKLIIRKYRDDFQILIPVNIIIQFLIDQFPQLIEGSWSLNWNDMGLGGPDFLLDGKSLAPATIFRGEDAFPKFLDQSIFFDDGEFRKESGEIVIGIHDSHHIYVIAAEDILLAISNLFDTDETEIE